MSKLNLSEAAAKILAEDAASNFAASKSRAGSEPFGVGNPKAVKKAPAPQTGEVDIGYAPTKAKTDTNPKGTAGMGAQATLPTGPGVAPAKFGDNPSKGSNASDYAALKNLGNSSLLGAGEESPEATDKERVAGVKSKTVRPTMSTNPKAMNPMVPESGEEEEWEPEDEDQEWEDDEELQEASVEEVMEDMESMDDEEFEATYGLTKEEAFDNLEENSKSWHLHSMYDFDTPDNSGQAPKGSRHHPALSNYDQDVSLLYTPGKNYNYTVLKDGKTHSTHKTQSDAEAKLVEMGHKIPTKNSTEFRNDVKQSRITDSKGKMKEDVDAMLSGENLSEEFKEKAAMIFEAAVESRVEEIASELEEQFIREFEESLELVKEDFAEKLDSYLDYVVENWMQENELAIEKGLRSEIVEDFIGALRNVFVEHYIDIPEDKVDIVEELAEKVESLEEQVNEQILKNIELKKSLSEQAKLEVIHSVCEGLTLSQVEKIKSLAKNVEFVSEEDFEEKLETIKESYFPSGVISASSDSLNEALEFDEDDTTEVVDPLIRAYATKISKLTKF